MLFQCIFTTLTPPGMNSESSLLEASSLSWYWSCFHPVMSHLCMFLYFLYVCLFPLTSPVRNECPSLSPSLPQTSPQSALSEPHLLAGTHMHLFFCVIIVSDCCFHLSSWCILMRWTIKKKISCFLHLRVQNKCSSDISVSQVSKRKVLYRSRISGWLLCWAEDTLAR